MKTTKLISALSFALIFATSTSVISAIPEKPSNREDKIQTNTITFNVNVHLSTDLAFCGTYQVQLVHADGSLVAPAQTFIPGKSNYEFTKVLWPDGVRPLYIWKTKITAMLVQVSASDQTCPTELNTRPESKMVLWTTGQTIRFDLYPNDSNRKNATIVRKIKE
jgi:hypothetical protein